MFGIRPYRLEDAKKIVTWCRDERSFYQWSAGLLDGFPISVQRLTDATSARMDNDRYFPFVAFDESGVVGFFTMRHPGESREELRFGFVILDPVIRGKGYGKQMIRLGLKYAFEIYGAKRVSLGVFENNPSAYRCYRAAGFYELPETETYRIMDEDWKCIELAVDLDSWKKSENA